MSLMRGSGEEQEDSTNLSLTHSPHLVPPCWLNAEAWRGASPLGIATAPNPEHSPADASRCACAAVVLPPDLLHDGSTHVLPSTDVGRGGPPPGLAGWEAGDRLPPSACSPLPTAPSWGPWLGDSTQPKPPCHRWSAATGAPFDLPEPAARAQRPQAPPGLEPPATPMDPPSGFDGPVASAPASPSTRPCATAALVGFPAIGSTIHLVAAPGVASPA